MSESLVGSLWGAGTANRPTSVIPVLRYRDATAAIDWLVNACGFTRHLVVDDGKGGITHAQLMHGSGMVMLGSAGNDPAGQSSVYIVVDDPDLHCAAARAAGAKIEREPEDQAYGGRDYTLRDPEGNAWSFGSYDPFESRSEIGYEEDDATATIEIRVAGKVTAAGFEDVAGRMEAFFERHESARIIEVIESFEGVDLSVLFDDMLFSMRHLRRFTHVAVVTDLRWAERMANAAAIILSARLRVFPLGALDEARRWAKTAA